MVNEKKNEFEDESFDRENFESIDKVIPFDAEDEPTTLSDISENMDEEEEDSVFLMGPASHDDIDITDIVEEREGEEKKQNADFSYTNKDKKRMNHTHFEKKTRLNFGRLFFGIVLVFIGLVFLGQNMGWFTIVNVDLLSLWPLILIFLGLSMFRAHRWWSKIFGLFVVLVVIAAVLAVLIGGSQFVSVNLTGKVIEEEREVSDFSRVVLQGVGSIIIEEGETESLVVRADEAVFSKIETSVSNEELTLKFVNPFFQFLFWGDIDIEYIIVVKDINAITINGAGSVTSSGISTDSLEVSINGSGKVDLDIDVKEFIARISGSGKYIIAGNAGRQIIHINGSGKYLGRDLISSETGIRISGSGEIEVYAEKELNVVINGSGKVRYLGEPFISNSSISGSGSIERFGVEVSDVLKDSSVFDKLKKIDEVKEFNIDE